MKVLVFGCGYLGWRAAESWLANGHQVTAVTRSENRVNTMRQAGFATCVADVTKPETLNQFDQPFDVVLFSVGFDRSRYDDIRSVYVDGFKNVLKRLHGDTGHLIYISSTGVYGNCDGQWVNEMTTPSPVRPGGKACLEAEELIARSILADRSTILRLAGIYGPGRVPRLASVLNQDWPALSQQGHINLIHVQDAAQIIARVADRKIQSETLLVSDGFPPKRKTFFDLVAELVGKGPINWDSTIRDEVSDRAAADKRVSNQRLLDKLSYKFQFPDYQSGIRQAIAETIKH